MLHEMMSIPVGIVPVWSVEVDQVVDADLGGVRLGEVEEGDVAQEPLGRHRGVVLMGQRRDTRVITVPRAPWEPQPVSSEVEAESLAEATG